MAIGLRGCEKSAREELTRARKLFPNLQEEHDCLRGAIEGVTSAAQAREFLGPYAKTILAFPDRHHEIVKAFGFDRLPAVVHVNMDGSVVNAAEGWFPTEWQTVTDALAQMMSWTGPVLPHPSDPGAFEGSPALG